LGGTSPSCAPRRGTGRATRSTATSPPAPPSKACGRRRRRGRRAPERSRTPAAWSGEQSRRCAGSLSAAPPLRFKALPHSRAACRVNFEACAAGRRLVRRPSTTLRFRYITRVLVPDTLRLTRVLVPLPQRQRAWPRSTACIGPAMRRLFRAAPAFVQCRRSRRTPRAAERVRPPDLGGRSNQARTAIYISGQRALRVPRLSRTARPVWPNSTAAAARHGCATPPARAPAAHAPRRARRSWQGLLQGARDAPAACGWRRSPTHPSAQVLGISRGADEATIKKNYRNLAKCAAAPEIRAPPADPAQEVAPGQEPHQQGGG